MRLQKIRVLINGMTSFSGDQKLVSNNIQKKDIVNQDGKLVEEEEALIGRVRWSIYLSYFEKIGPYTCILICKLHNTQFMHVAKDTVWETI